MRYSTVPAINLEAHIARNRELIMAKPTKLKASRVWNPERLEFDPISNHRVTY